MSSSLERGKCESDSADSEEEESEDEAEAEAEGLLSLIRKSGGRDVLELPFEASTYDGLALSGILFTDAIYRRQEGFSGPFFQLVFMTTLHSFTVLGQFLLVYWTFISGLETGYDPYAQAKTDADVIEAALSHDPPVSLSNGTNSGAVDIVKWCRADSTHPASHQIVIAIWATRMVMELADATWRCYRIWFLDQAKQRRLVDWKRETPAVTSLTLELKIFLIMFLSVPQYLIAVSLSWTGAKLLVAAQNMPGLVLKALTLQYIIGLDELVFTAFSSVRFKQVANQMKFLLVTSKPTHQWRSSDAWRSWGSNTLKLLASLVYLGLVCYVFSDLRRLRTDCQEYFQVFPEERGGHIHAKHWVFGKVPAWMEGWV